MGSTEHRLPGIGIELPAFRLQRDAISLIDETSPSAGYVYY